MLNSLSLSATNPMRIALASLLWFDVVVFGLSFPVMTLVSDTSSGTALTACSVASLLAITSALTLRKRWGYIFGWLAQIAGMMLGFLAPMMFAVGGIFALIWTISFILGKRLEANVG